MTTFEDVERKYCWAVEHMDFCTNAALNDNFSSHATWIHPPTLARWLHGSIDEFAQEFYRYRRTFETEIPAQSERIGKQYNDIDFIIWQSGDRIFAKYPELRGELA